MRDLKWRLHQNVMGSGVRSIIIMKFYMRILNWLIIILAVNKCTVKLYVYTNGRNTYLITLIFVSGAPGPSINRVSCAKGIAQLSTSAYLHHTQEGDLTWQLF